MKVKKLIKHLLKLKKHIIMYEVMQFSIYYGTGQSQKNYRG